MQPDTSLLRADGIHVSYEDRLVLRDLSVDIPSGRITTIIGPNACGKSTLLRTLARLLVPGSGQVILDGQNIQRYPTREVARRMGVLPQTSTAPGGISVADLVARGRFPHQSLLRQWSEEDALAVSQALADTGTTALAERAVDALSGGQRQRVWLAMVLAQQTPILLLDEPTTYLDIAHQIEVLQLCRKLNLQQGRTLVMVLHDLNQAVRYSDRLIVMKEGAIVASGVPQDVINAQMLEQVFHISAQILTDPLHDIPLIVPESVTRHDD